MRIAIYGSGGAGGYSGGRLEAPWLCGGVVRMSAEVSLEAPVNRTIYAALKPFLDGSQVKAS